MPGVKVLLGSKRPVLTVLLVASAGTLALLLWLQVGRSGSQPEETFRSFRNLTRFSNQDVWMAYRFAVASFPGVLSYIPCFCGCVYRGHANNGDCYIDGFDRLGKPIFDPHAAG